MPSKATRDKTEGKGVGKPRTKAAKRPTIITVDGDGREKTWGPLSRSAAWRAGSFWEEMDGTVKVFLEKDGKRNGVHVEKRIQGGRICFWFDEKTPQHPQQPQEGEVDDETETVEEVNGVDEVTPDEMQQERMMWLTEKATTLENEKEELKRVIRDMEAKIALQENTIKEIVTRHLIVENAITQIAEHNQQQNAFNESARSSVTGGSTISRSTKNSSRKWRWCCRTTSSAS